MILAAQTRLASKRQPPKQKRPTARLLNTQSQVHNLSIDGVNELCLLGNRAHVIRIQPILGNENQTL
jgi:hypothetical protein